MNFNEIVPELAAGIIKHCEEWNYDWIEKLKEKPTVENFFRLFCKFTKTYFFDMESGCYGARFKKTEETVEIYKCGKDCHNILAKGSMKALVQALAGVENNIESEKEGKTCYGHEKIHRRIRN